MFPDIDTDFVGTDLAGIDMDYVGTDYADIDKDFAVEFVYLFLIVNFNVLLNYSETSYKKFLQNFNKNRFILLLKFVKI